MTNRFVPAVAAALLTFAQAQAAPVAASTRPASAVIAPAGASADATVESRPLAAHPPGAAIASANKLATEAGFEVLAKGGNAFDAAIAVSATLGVVEPVSSGLGGGGFFLLHDARSGRDVMLDAREIAPQSATPAVYLDAKGGLDRDKAENGATSAGIPGLPAALVHLQEHYGRLPLSVSLAPAIRIARDGFALYPRMVAEFAERKAVMERYPATRTLFLARGRDPKVGDVFVQKDLAHTLELLVAKGFDGFYRGPVAREILATVKADGVTWTADELAGYRVKERAPIVFSYRGMRIVTASPPSSGGVALAEILNILEGWDLAKLDDAHRVHVIVEAMRRAFRDRTFYLGDPDFVKMPLRRLTSRDYAAGLRASILPDKATPSAMLPGELAPLESNNTTHFAVMDDAGNIVSATQTVNLAYGSGMVVGGAGFLLNDEMDDFALRPGTPNAFGVMGYDANAVAAGRRMLSSMSPTIVFGKDRIVALGAKGGTRIITAVLLGILGVEQGMDAAQIVAIPRYHQQYLPDKIYEEPGALSAATRQALGAMGYAIVDSTSPLVFMHAVGWNRRDDTLHAGADPRNPPGAGMVRLDADAPASRSVPARAAHR